MIPMPPFGLMAGAVIAIVVAASGWYILSGLRAADRAEIESLAEVANRNAAAAAEAQRHAEHYAETVQAASDAHNEREQDLHRRLRALREANDEQATDPGECVPGRLRWSPAEDGDGSATPDVPADTPAPSV